MINLEWKIKCKYDVDEFAPDYYLSLVLCPIIPGEKTLLSCLAKLNIYGSFNKKLIGLDWSFGRFKFYRWDINSHVR